MKVRNLAGERMQLTPDQDGASPVLVLNSGESGDFESYAGVKHRVIAGSEGLEHEVGQYTVKDADEDTLFLTAEGQFSLGDTVLIHPKRSKSSFYALDVRSEKHFPRWTFDETINRAAEKKRGQGYAENLSADTTKGILKLSGTGPNPTLCWSWPLPGRSPARGVISSEHWTWEGNYGLYVRTRPRADLNARLSWIFDFAFTGTSRFKKETPKSSERQLKASDTWRTYSFPFELRVNQELRKATDFYMYNRLRNRELVSLPFKRPVEFRLEG